MRGDAERMCLDKTRYPSKKAARAISKLRRGQGHAATAPYCCPICQGWHLTKRKTAANHRRKRRRRREFLQAAIRGDDS